LKHIFVIATAVLCLLASRPAEAQIYSWKDANGVLTLSNQPHEGARMTPLTPAVTARVAPAGLLSGGTRYEPLIVEHSRSHAVRPDLVRAVIQVESAFNPRAVSPKGAMGLMQLMPTTAAQYGVLDPFNPAENIRAGVRYLRMLLDKYSNNEQLALAAYNAGPTAVDKYGNKIPPYRETQSYVKRITMLNGTLSNGAGARIYKVEEIVDGRLVVRYTNTKPAGGTYSEVRR
jgi:soluble lytic murein transglycosylase-like protein